MIGITGVTGKLGSYVAYLIDQQGIASVHLARSPDVLRFTRLRKSVECRIPILQRW